MSRSRISAAASWSRQMMMAWKVSGLSQSPSIMVSRPASMRLAMAISPSRREQLDRAHFAQVHAHRIVGAVAAFAGVGFAGDGGAGLFGELGRFLFRGVGLGLFDLVLVDDVDAHVREHRHDVLDLLGGDLLRGQNGVQLFIGDVAALLGGLDQLLYGGIGKVEQGRIRGFRAAAPARCLRLLRVLAVLALLVAALVAI